MAEYIEREALLKHKTLIPGFIGEYVLVDRITEAPAADVVPVIRCRECIMHDNCTTEDIFKFSGMNLGKTFCCCGGLIK